MEDIERVDCCLSLLLVTENEINPVTKVLAHVVAFQCLVSHMSIRDPKECQHCTSLWRWMKILGSPFAQGGRSTESIVSPVPCLAPRKIVIIGYHKDM